MTDPSFETFITADGTPLIGCHHTPPSGTPARAVAIIAPAMGVRQDFYRPFARWLSAQGVASYTFDYRGAGRSAPPTGLRDFRASITDWATLDCDCVIARAREQHPGLPIVWIGHSVGAQILGLIPNAHAVTAMLSIAAGSGYYRHNTAPLRYYVKPVLWNLVMPLATRLSGYFPGAKLGMVGDLPTGVALQWRSWCLNADYLGGEGKHVRDRVAQLSLPITAWYMRDDELMTLRGTRALFALYAGADVELRQISPAEHGLRSIGHFGFFRANMEATLWPLALQWIDRVVPATRVQSVA